MKFFSLRERLNRWREARYGQEAINWTYYSSPLKELFDDMHRTISNQSLLEQPSTPGSEVAEFD
jgi:hypothetical protein